MKKKKRRVLQGPSSPPPTLRRVCADQQVLLGAQHLLGPHPVQTGSQIFSAAQRQRLGQVQLARDPGQRGRRPQRRGVVLPGDDLRSIKTGPCSQVTAENSQSEFRP